MNLNDIQDLLVKLNTNSNDHIKPLNPFLNTLDAFSRTIEYGIYVIDYKKRGFIYVSPNPLFLCGYKAEEVLKLGYSFYEKVVVKEDLAMLDEIDKKGYELFSRLSPEARMKSMLSYDYRIKQPGDKTMMVNQRNTPLFLSEQGDVRFALCIVNLSTHNQPGNVMIRVDDILHNYRYSFEGKKWKKETRILITNREKDVLQLAASGCSNEEIANTLFINVSTVKFHKTNIYNKLNVKNITEAVVFAYNHKLL